MGASGSRGEDSVLENTSYAHLGVLLLVVVTLVPAVIAMVATLRCRDLGVVTTMLWLAVLTLPIVGIVLWLAVKPAGPLTTGGRAGTP
jgi:hypothetical protein